MAKKSKAKRNPNVTSGSPEAPPIPAPNGKATSKGSAGPVSPVAKATSNKGNLNKSAANRQKNNPSRAGAASRSAAPVVERVMPPLTESAYWRVALIVLIVAIAVRQIQLANFPFHPDEAIHAWWSQRLMEGSYNFDPTYHGPVLYHLVAVIFAIPFFGENDFTARLVPSLLGLGLLALVVGPARRWLGARGALWSLALIALSPVIVAYHRRLLHDALVMFLTLSAVLCFQILRENPAWTKRGRWARIGLVAALALFLATKANAFFVIAMLIAFWIITLVQGQWRKWFADRQPVVAGGAAFFQRIVPLALFVFISIASVYALRDAPVLARNEALFKLASVFTVLVMAFWLVIDAPADNTEIVDARLVEDEEELAEDGEAADTDSAPLSRDALIAAEPARQRRAAWQTYLLAAFAGLFLFSFMFGAGYLWWKIPVEMVTNWSGWLEHFKASWSDILGVAFRRAQPPYLQFAPDWDRVTDAIPRMLEYWGGQQKAPRLPGRHDYYIPLMVMYELPIMLAGLYGVWRASRRRTPFTDLLLWWTLTSYVLYAMANEKVPWLLCHIMLPLALLGGWGLAHLYIDTAPKRNALVAACALSAIFLLRNISATNWERAGDNHEPILYAQTTDTFRDTFMKTLQDTVGDPGPIWPREQWPSAWYLRKDAPWVGQSAVWWGAEPGVEAPRMILGSEDLWRQYGGRFPDYRVQKTEYFIWPRPSWPALLPDRFFRWWLTRDTAPGGDVQKGVLASPGEWSSNQIVIATPN